MDWVVMLEGLEKSLDVATKIVNYSERMRAISAAYANAAANVGMSSSELLTALSNTVRGGSQIGELVFRIFGFAPQSVVESALAQSAKAAAAAAEAAAAEAAAAEAAEAAATASRGARFLQWIVSYLPKPAFIGGAAAALVVGGVIVYAGSRLAGTMAADSPVQPGPAMSIDRTSTDPTVANTSQLPGQSGEYYIYAINTSGWSFYIGQPSEVEGHASKDFADGGTGDQPIEFKRLVSQPFNSSDEAKEYLKTHATPGKQSVWDRPMV